VTGINEIEVEALPQDLPEKLVLDISKLANIGDGIYVRDLVVSEKVEILEEPEEMVVIITGEMGEEVAEEAAGAEEPEVIERGKKEEEIPD
jgi:large subunit ribosomal protein L25